MMISQTSRPSSYLQPLNNMSADAMQFPDLSGNTAAKSSRPFFNALQQHSSRAIAPLAIIGGTASIYSAALSHSSSTLTPLSVVYLFLLALNYSIMPRISKKFVHPKTNKKSLALVEEMVKFSMGVGGFLITDNFSSLKKWTLQSSLIAAGLPSALYAIQGVFTYTAYQNLDSLTFNGLNQMKTLSAALCCFLVLGKVQSHMQILALALLSITPWIFEGKPAKLMKRGQNEAKHVASDVDLKRRFIWGIVPCLGATLLSGLAGAFSQKSLQMVVGSMDRNAYFYSAEISLSTAVCLFVSMGVESLNPRRRNVEIIKDNPTGVKHAKYFDYWSWKTLIPITLKATGGILTALVHKHSGSVMKGFSLVLGLVISALLQTALDGEDLGMSQIFGTALILLSSWLHFTSPP